VVDPVDDAAAFRAVAAKDKLQTPSRPAEIGAGQRERGERDRDFHPQGPAYGALDLGTNNCRLLIARPSRRGFLVVDAFSRIIRLGEGVTATGRLSDHAMDRTVDALRVCANKLARAGVSRYRLVATEACRIADNGQAFLDRVRTDTGLEIEILSRENEARLAVSGCAALLDRHSNLVLVFDIGGGSSELIWLDLTRCDAVPGRSMHERMEAQNAIAAWTSLSVGVVTLAEQFGGRHVTRADFEAMVSHVLSLLEPFEREHGFRKRLANERAHLLGTSGTVTTVAGIHMGLKRYDRSRVDGHWMRTRDALGVTQSLLNRTYEERVAEPCIGRDRADLVLAGCAILEAIARVWPCESLRVADRGLREGILASLMAEDGVYRGSRRRHGSGR
jgi:exopolyphosphatase/guanosine-5'-triphosphate,3'-diphosphate pyrophosphatase